MGFEGPSWGSITLIVIGTVTFLAGIYLKPREADIKWILNKNVMRWESPVLIGVGAALDSFPIEDILIIALPAMFILSGVGIWSGFREVNERKKRGEKFDDER